MVFPGSNQSWGGSGPANMGHPSSMPYGHPADPHQPPMFQSVTQAWSTDASPGMRRVAFAAFRATKRISLLLIIATAVMVHLKRDAVGQAVEELPILIFQIVMGFPILIAGGVSLISWAARPSVPEKPQFDLEVSPKAFLFPQSLPTEGRLRRSMRWNNLLCILTVICGGLLVASFVLAGSPLASATWYLYGLTLFLLIWLAFTSVEINSRTLLTGMGVLAQRGATSRSDTSFIPARASGTDPAQVPEHLRGKQDPTHHYGSQPTDPDPTRRYGDLGGSDWGGPANNGPTPPWGGTPTHSGPAGPWGASGTPGPTGATPWDHPGNPGAGPNWPGQPGGGPYGSTPGPADPWNTPGPQGPPPHHPGDPNYPHDPGGQGNWPHH